MLLASIWLLHEGVCAEWVGGVLLASDLRRRVGNSSGTAHISVLGMTLELGVETLWCYVGLHLAAQEGVYGVGGRRALAVGFAAK